MSLINSEHLQALSPLLKEILHQELEYGNTIAETSKGWPKADSIFVSLKRPFTKPYRVHQSVVYLEIDDRHYWKAEYSDTQLGHLLVCGFG